MAAYLPAHYHRLGPNYQELPINRPICSFHSNQRRGSNAISIDVDRVWYHENSMANNTPYTTPPEEGGYEHYQRKLMDTQSGREVNHSKITFRNQGYSGIA
ncbi:catalase [Lentibacillus jeotgali]|uniref:catalase n=1 Tax=Lentibacillus jeotgali TaxID=558169 RepID=UPI001FE1EC96|nr:catalase [Lentibacillus jeotgali]